MAWEAEGCNICGCMEVEVLAKDMNNFFYPELFLSNWGVSSVPK